jgi:hypothetical protein
MASLQASVFTFLDEYHILFPSSIDDGFYVYDVRAMPPINIRKQKLKGTHCFEISISPILGPRDSLQHYPRIQLADNGLRRGDWPLLHESP